MASVKGAGTAVKAGASAGARAGAALGATATSENPLLAPWATPFEMPPFGKIRAEHFVPAFNRAFADHIKEVEAIAGDRAKPTFENTIEGLERAGRGLDRVASVFYNLAGTDTDAAIQAIERKIAPRFAKHHMRIYQDAKLFKRVDVLVRGKGKLGLTEEQVRVLERYNRGFERAGAALRPKVRERMAAIAERLATLATRFNQNVLADEQAYLLLLESEDELAGLPEALRAAAAQTAAERGHKGKYAISLARSSIESFLQFSARRDLREQAYKAWRLRGANGGKTDNRKIVAEILALRAERARLLGFSTPADAALEFTMAKTPRNVRKLLMQVWKPAKARAAIERAELDKAVLKEGGNFELAGWDWRYYAEKVRKARFDVDESEVKPYLALDRVIAAAFDCASRLFGVGFKERTDLPVYNPEVRSWQVVGKDGRHVGLFLGDYFARPSKRSGAWMSAWRKAHKLDAEEIRPIVVNVMNFAKGAPGEPALLSLDDARTLFHEFGHALHGLLTDVTYPSVSGTSVERDFVELPSQLYEHWFMAPEVFKSFARHYQSGKPLPEALLGKIKAARNFNQGFATVEYTAAAIVDLDLHALKDTSQLDVDAFEKETLERLGVPAEIGMRHRIPHFQHIIGGYASGYYSYMWSEVMDADAFSAFEEAGDIFDPALAKKLHDHIYAAGGTRDPAKLYKAFRGRQPKVQALLEKRGLAA
ncbi:MAG: M3 family metallopeptidase [Hyphomicrobiaceae bacterium]|nr:M3 family metallopeptidase [Hyphomicrobiaceae bacterium]